MYLFLPLVLLSASFLGKHSVSGQGAFINLEDLGVEGRSGGFTVNGVDSNDRAGFSVGSGGDVNGDGIDDFAIAATLHDPDDDKSNPARVYVVFGTANSTTTDDPIFDLTTLNGINGFVLNGLEAFDQIGLSLSLEGDINGDGINDIVVGAPRANINETTIDPGVVYVLFGSNSTWEPSFDLLDLNRTSGFVVNGMDANDRVGYSVASGGDVNGDAVHDLVIGAPGFDDPEGSSYPGKVYVIFGSRDEMTSPFDMSSLNGTNGFVMNGTDNNDGAGWSVTSSGDVNGDTVADIIIGAPWAGKKNRPRHGEVYVVFGSTSLREPSLNLSDLNGTNGVIFTGRFKDDSTGYSVSSGGDFNGDGVDDFCIGAPHIDSETPVLRDDIRGKVYVLYGLNQTSWPSPFSLHNDLSESDGFKVSGSRQGDRTGFSVSSGSDVDGDGLADAIFSAPFARRFTGDVYVWFGTRMTYASTLYPSLLDGTRGFTLRGINTTDLTGASVSSLSDVNGDGAPDIVIGAPAADSNGNLSTGKVYVVYGVGPPPTAAPSSSPTEAPCQDEFNEYNECLGGQDRRALQGLPLCIVLPFLPCSDELSCEFPSFLPCSAEQSKLCECQRDLPPSSTSTASPSAAPSAAPSVAPSSGPTGAPGCQDEFDEYNECLGGQGRRALQGGGLPLPFLSCDFPSFLLCSAEQRKLCECQRDLPPSSTPNASPSNAPSSAPTTQTPATPLPTMEVSATDAPSSPLPSQAPSTSLPTTQASLTSSPTTQAPSSPMPTTQATPSETPTSEEDSQCFVKKCCEDECCGAGTSWSSTQGCFANATSDGWDGADQSSSSSDDSTCRVRICCEADCCGRGTYYVSSVMFCLPY